jgi:hypothetical protein
LLAYIFNLGMLAYVVLGSFAIGYVRYAFHRNDDYRDLFIAAEMEKGRSRVQAIEAYRQLLATMN